MKVLVKNNLKGDIEQDFIFFILKILIVIVNINFIEITVNVQIFDRDRNFLVKMNVEVFTLN